MPRQANKTPFTARKIQKFTVLKIKTEISPWQQVKIWFYSTFSIWNIGQVLSKHKNCYLKYLSPSVQKTFLLKYFRFDKKHSFQVSLVWTVLGMHFDFVHLFFFLVLIGHRCDWKIWCNEIKFVQACYLIIGQVYSMNINQGLNELKGSLNWLGDHET